MTWAEAVPPEWTWGLAESCMAVYHQISTTAPVNQQQVRTAGVGSDSDGSLTRADWVNKLGTVGGVFKYNGQARIGLNENIDFTVDVEFRAKGEEASAKSAIREEKAMNIQDSPWNLKTRETDTIGEDGDLSSAPCHLYPSISSKQI